MHPIRHLAKHHSKKLKLATVFLTFVGLIVSLTMLGQALFAEEMIAPYSLPPSQEKTGDVPVNESGLDGENAEIGPIAKLRQVIFPPPEEKGPTDISILENARETIEDEAQDVATKVIQERAAAAVDATAEGLLDTAASATGSSSSDQGEDGSEESLPDQTTEEQLEAVEGAMTSFWSATWGKLWPFLKSMAVGLWNTLTDFIQIEVTPAETGPEASAQPDMLGADGAEEVLTTEGAPLE